LRDGGAYLLWITRIKLDGLGTAPRPRNVRDDPPSILGAAQEVDVNLCTARPEQARNRRPDAAAAAGNQRNLAGEPEFGCGFLIRGALPWFATRDSNIAHPFNYPRVQANI